MPAYMRIYGQLVHREMVVALTPGTTWFRKRPYLDVCYEASHLGRPSWGFLYYNPDNGNDMRHTARFEFESEAVRDAYADGMARVCPNLRDWELGRTEKEGEPQLRPRED